MKLNHLGQSGLKISALTLGTMTLGEADETSVFHGIGCEKKEAFRILDRAIDAGINCLDSANVYGNDGMVESLLGEYFSQSKCREKIILATKFRFTMGQGAHDSGASRKHIMAAIEDSLRRLKTDYVDLYQIHMQDINTPEEETLSALDQLIKQGKVRYIGASNYAAYRFLESLVISDKFGFEKYISMQMQYNLMCRDIEREHIPLCKKYKTGIMAWSPLSGGFLTGKYVQGQGPKEARFSIQKDWRKQIGSDRAESVVEGVQKVASELDVSCAQVAIAWLLQQPCVETVIIGARKLSQLEDNLLAAKINLQDEHLEILENASKFSLGYPYNFLRARQGNW